MERGLQTCHSQKHYLEASADHWKELGYAAQQLAASTLQGNEGSS